MITLEALLYLIFGLTAGRLSHTPLLKSLLLNRNSAVMYELTLLNLAVDLLTVVGFIVLVVLARRAHERHERRQTWVLVGLLLATIMMTTVHHAVVRQTRPDSDITHDGLVQSEVAARLLLHGKNPYTADFSGTVAARALARVDKDVPVDQSPLTHYVYPPLIPLLVMPSVVAADIISINPEGQTMFILVFIVGSLYLAWQAKTWPERRLLLVLTMGNPFIWLYIVAGYNDIVAAALAVAAAVSLQRRRWMLAGLMFGLALAAKQTWWIMIPLWALWLWRLYRNSAAADRLALRRSVLTTVLALGVIYGPFIVWNAPALYDDLVSFVSATSTAYYPISGSTFWQLAVIIIAPSSPWRATAHGLTQLIVGVPMLITMCWWMWKKPGAATWLTAAVVLMLSLTIVNRFAYDNYFAAIMFVAVAAYALEHFARPSKLLE